MNEQKAWEGYMETLLDKQPPPKAAGGKGGFVNTSGLHPLGHAVLIRTYEPELKSSVIEIPEQVKHRMEMVEQRAEVVEVGPDAWKHEAEKRAKPGDRVLVTKYAGFLVAGKDSADGNTYRLVNANDIFCRIDEQQED